jgi:hypothetical protein
MTLKLSAGMLFLDLLYALTILQTHFGTLNSPSFALGIRIVGAKQLIIIAAGKMTRLFVPMSGSLLYGNRKTRLAS